MQILSATILLSLCASAHASPIHTPFDSILKETSKDGWVDYARLKADRGPLDDYLKTLEKVPQKTEKGWSRAERLAFWINAYNAATLKTIIDHYPIKKPRWSIKGAFYPDKSIKQIPGAFDGIRHQVAGRTLTLNQLEHEVLRAEIDEPRIHAAIVCASVGCPPLRGEAYTADRIEEQLEDNMRKFLEEKNRLNPQGGSIALSKIFDWFSEDFERFDDGTFAAYPKKIRGVLSFAKSRIDPKTVSGLLREKASLEWIDYDWSLNDRRLRLPRSSHRSPGASPPQ